MSSAEKREALKKLSIAKKHLQFWQKQVVDLRNVLAPKKTAASRVKAQELEHIDVDYIDEAVRYIAIRSGGVFRPSIDKVPLIEAGFISGARWGGNKLNTTLHEMPDMKHTRRNLWELINA